MGYARYGRARRLRNYNVRRVRNSGFVVDDAVKVEMARLGELAAIGAAREDELAARRMAAERREAIKDFDREYLGVAA